MLLALLMVFCSCPITVFAAEADTVFSSHITGKVADPSTINEWSQLMGSEMTPISTVNAGGVGTDKSVFSNEEQDVGQLPG